MTGGAPGKVGEVARFRKKTKSQLFSF
jgi:hypothetical protein